MAGRKTSGKKKSFFDMYDEMVKQAQEEVNSVESDVTAGMKNIRELEEDINKALGERASLYTKIKEDLDYRQGIADRISEVALSEITLALGDIVDPLVDAETMKATNEESSNTEKPEVEAETAVKKGAFNVGDNPEDLNPVDPDSESSSGIEDLQSVVADDGVSTDSDDADESEDDSTGDGEEETSDSQDDGDLNDGNESEPITDENNESDSGDDANEDVRVEEPVNPKRARRKTSKKKKNEARGNVEPAPVEDLEDDAVSGTTGDSVVSDVVIDDLPGDGDEAEIPDDLDDGSNPTEEADLTGGDEPLDADADVDDPAGSESGEPTLIGEDTPYSDEEMDFGL